MPVIIRGSFTLNAFSDAPIDVYEELILTKNIKYQYDNPLNAIRISDETMQHIMLYINMGSYASLPLHQFLDKISVAD